MQMKTVEHINKQLDIQSLVQTRIDLSILIRLLLNKEQRLLFKNQHIRSMRFDPVEEPDDKNNTDKALFVPNIVT